MEAGREWDVRQLRRRIAECRWLDLDQRMALLGLCDGELARRVDGAEGATLLARLRRVLAELGAAAA